MDIQDIPKIDLKEMEAFKKQNFKERLAFIDFYSDWLKRTPNKEWSRQQKELIDAQVPAHQPKKKE